MRPVRPEFSTVSAERSYPVSPPCAVKRVGSEHPPVLVKHTVDDQIRAVGLDNVSRARFANSMAHVRTETHASHTAEIGCTGIIFRTADDAYTACLAFVHVV